MFYQTYTALMPPSPCHPLAATQWSHLLVQLVCSVQHTLQCIVSGDDSAVFSALSLVTLTFEALILTFKLMQARNQTRLPCKFGANLFSRS